jgi:hypothetical protein
MPPQPRAHPRHRPAGNELDNRKAYQQNAEQGGEHKQKAAEDV